MAYPLWVGGVPVGTETFEHHLRECLSPLLGPHTTGRAIKLACDRLEITSGRLTWRHCDAVADLLAPMLGTLSGRVSTEVVVAKIVGKGVVR